MCTNIHRYVIVLQNFHHRYLNYIASADATSHLCILIHIFILRFNFCGFCCYSCFRNCNARTILASLFLPSTRAMLIEYSCFYFLSIVYFDFFRENFAQHTTHARIRSVGQHKREHYKSSEAVGVGRRRGKHTRIQTHSIRTQA